MENNVVALQQPKNGFLMEPQSLNEAMELANMLSSSNLVPKPYQNKPADVLVACQWGAEIGLKPLQSLQNIAVINNIPAVWGDAVVALVRASGLCEYIKQDWDEKTQTATCTVKRKNEPEEVRTFSREDANIAGHLGKDTYKKNLRRMLSIRARAFALRDVFADVLKGLKVAEEVMDYPEEKDVTPTPSQMTAKPASKAAAVLDKVRRNKPEPADQNAGVTVDQDPQVVEYTDEQRAQLDSVIEKMGYCESLQELKAVANEIAAIGVIPDDERARATSAYHENQNRIKDAFQQSTNV